MPYLGTKGLKASDIRRFNVTGSTSATHTLTWVAPTEQSLIVTINGVKQQEDAYSVSGTTLTLTSALVATDKMEVVGINDVGTTVTPAQNSVNLDKLATTGTPSSSTFLRGDMAWTAVSDTSGLASVQVFTSSGTYTKPSGVRLVMVEVQGAGGSGVKGTANDKRNNGGAGGYARKLIDVSSVSSATITIGSGGLGSTSNDTKGGDGGDSIWSDGTNTVTGFGGDAAEVSGYLTGLGGSASGGDLNFTGQAGGRYACAIGGNSFLGHGGTDQYASARASEIDGKLGGGGSTVYYTYPAAAHGGNGGDGIVIVTEYK
jgi:hypothetical protein